jgi:type I restriction enzyme M protein
MGRGVRNSPLAAKGIGNTALNNAIKSICDVMRRDNCKGALEYVPELTWILFLRILDERETEEAEIAKASGAQFSPTLRSPFRWRDWGDPAGKKRQELQTGKMGGFLKFINAELLPTLADIGKGPRATSRQKVVGQVFAGRERTRMRTEKNFLDVLDKVHELSHREIDDTHVFPLSQVFEGLLLQMGQKNNDGGQFFTPREIIRAIVRTVNPKIGQTICDPACGTGGFLAQSYEYLEAKAKSPKQIEVLKTATFFGREADDTAFPIGLANLVLHGIDAPKLWHGNTLSGAVVDGSLYEGAPAQFDTILTNPPFGGREGIDAQAHFDFKTTSTSVLFLQHIIETLKPGGTCGMVIDEGVLYRSTEKAYLETKRWMLETCDLWCIVSLPSGVFTNAGAGVKTNLLFFTKGKATERIWYYDLSDVKVNKSNPFTLDRFDDFFAQLPTRASGDRSWTVTIEEIKKANYSIKAVNPNAPDTSDRRPPEELLCVIEQAQAEITQGVAALRASLVSAQVTSPADDVLSEPVPRRDDLRGASKPSRRGARSGDLQRGVERSERRTLGEDAQ